MSRFYENRTTVLPISAGFKWRRSRHGRVKRWLFRLFRRPLLP